jgi:hypothetical protein
MENGTESEIEKIAFHTLHQIMSIFHENNILSTLADCTDEMHVAMCWDRLDRRGVGPSPQRGGVRGNKNTAPWGHVIDDIINSITIISSGITVSSSIIRCTWRVTQPRRASRRLG